MKSWAHNIIFYRYGNFLLIIVHKNKTCDTYRNRICQRVEIALMLMIFQIGVFKKDNSCYDKML